MHPVVGLLCYIPYDLILSQIITGRWGPAAGALLLPLPSVDPMPVNLGVSPTVSEAETLVKSQCPEFYTGDTLILSQAIYLGLFWPTEKAACVQVQSLCNLEDLAHTVDEQVIVAFAPEPPSSSLESSPATQEMLIWLDFLLSWCRPFLKQPAVRQENMDHPNLLGPSVLWPRESGYKVKHIAELWPIDSSRLELP
ncbi:hypothetical protein DSO57_1017178 [Entomophthora muscae]|uniref:Uncharacterized protein n=1 Tax=Entomophthora muscae TaxID=34485 RepID=A0ACC2TSP0_9FUNG|nr:hypothetical protein DSO57_1017178 [Entomophthora muscae]